ncbi:hypothetical protein V1525DRAFT_403933 [Lipomyces kononenkoae]|uniref:Uncharacterized protein n=1 Tax=Lipomyces kononenkoae TaxID=34357 RepID=A0ACC3T0J1_LIPKO
MRLSKSAFVCWTIVIEKRSSNVGQRALDTTCISSILLLLQPAGVNGKAVCNVHGKRGQAGARYPYQTQWTTPHDHDWYYGIHVRHTTQRYLCHLL